MSLKWVLVIFQLKQYRYVRTKVYVISLSSRFCVACKRDSYKIHVYVIFFNIKIIQDGLSVVVLGPAFESFKIIVRHCHLGHPKSDINL